MYRTVMGSVGLLLTMVVVMLQQGCNIVGPIAYVVSPEPTIDAEYILPPERPLVVYVDDRRNMLSPASLKRVIADTVTETLMDEEVVTRTISSRDAMAIVSQHDRASEPMPMDAIGRAVGAEVVIYIEVLGFRMEQSDAGPRLSGSCLVRVIDAVNKERMYPPADSQVPARTVSTLLPEMNPEMVQSRSEELKTYEGLAILMGSDVAKLFFDHKYRELGGRLNPR